MCLKNIMAKRAFSKIQSNVFKNFSRLFSFKYEMGPASRLSTGPVEEMDGNSGRSFRYNIYQPRAAPPEKITADTSKTTTKSVMDQQYLQSSKLPEYYKNQVDQNALVPPETQRFQVSNTCANASLPLKSVKLASPFPEPVKMVMSRTISDDEKAAQMLADSRCERHFSDRSGKPRRTNYRSFSTEKPQFFGTASESGKC